MSDKTLHELPNVEPRESNYDLEFLRRRLSGIEFNDVYFKSETVAFTEMILCLANKISELEKEIKDIKAAAFD